MDILQVPTIDERVFWLGQGHFFSESRALERLYTREITVENRRAKTSVEHNGPLGVN